MNLRFLYNAFLIANAAALQHACNDNPCTDDEAMSDLSLLQTQISVQPVQDGYVERDLVAAQGYVVGDENDEINGVTRAGCAQECDKNAECKSFSYNPSTNGGSCYLMDKCVTAEAPSGRPSRWKTYYKPCKASLQEKSPTNLATKTEGPTFIPGKALRAVDLAMNRLVDPSFIPGKALAPPCKQKVYVYELPSNLSWVEKPDESIDSIFGKQHKTYSFLRDTNQYRGAEIIYYRLRHSKCRTLNPKEADLFYMPIMARLPLCGFWPCSSPPGPSSLVERGESKQTTHESDPSLVIRNEFDQTTQVREDVSYDTYCSAIKNRFTYKDMLAWLPHFNEKSAHKHFLVLSNEHFTFRQCTGWFADPEGLFTKAMRVAVTPTLPDLMAKDMAYMDWGSEEFFKHEKYPNLYSLSPPSSVHYEADRPPWNVNPDRPILMQFIGSAAHGDKTVRQKILDQCDSYKDSKICYHSEYNFDVLANAMDSKFCLQPAGDTPERKSIADSVALGCIPVFFHPAQPLMFGINWEDWSAHISIPRQEFLNGGVDLHHYLAAIPKDVVQSMQQILYHHARNFQYRVDDNAADQLSKLLDYLNKKAQAQAIRT